MIVVGLFGAAGLNWRSELSGAGGKLAGGIMIGHSSLTYYSHTALESWSSAENAIKDSDFNLAINKLEQVKKNMRDIENEVSYTRPWSLLSNEPYDNMMDFTQNSRELADSIITGCQRKQVTSGEMDRLAENLNSLDNLIHSTFRKELDQGMDYITIISISNSSGAGNRIQILSPLENDRWKI